MATRLTLNVRGTVMCKRQSVQSVQPQKIGLGPLSASFRMTNDGVCKAMGWPIWGYFSVSEGISGKVGSATSWRGCRTWLTRLNTYKGQAGNVIMWGRHSVSNAGHGEANGNQRAHVQSNWGSHQGAANKCSPAIISSLPPSPPTSPVSFQASLSLFPCWATSSVYHRSMCNKWEGGVSGKVPWEHRAEGVGCSMMGLMETPCHWLWTLKGGGVQPAEVKRKVRPDRKVAQAKLLGWENVGAEGT